MSLPPDLVKKLKENVFPEDGLKVISETKTLTDLRSLARRVNSKGQTLINILEKKDYIKAVRSRVRSLHEVSDEELAHQHLKLLQIIKDLDIADDDKRDSKDIICSLLSSKTKLFRGIETILHAIYVGAISTSVETDAKSVISMYSLHNSYLRPAKDETIDNEMICQNGPSLGECNSVLRAALKDYFTKNQVEKDAHFLTSSRLKMRKFTTSKVVDRLQKIKSKLPFME